jgi:putative ABC transport system ATP-binding protein
MSRIACTDVTWAVDGSEVLAGVSLAVDGGTRGAVIGPSGSGKTTLLTILAGLIAPVRGSVTRDGRAAFILQGYGLVTLLTAAENIEIALRAAGRDERLAGRRAAEMLDRLGLGPYADHLVDELSGGQQQRTAVARALALEPEILLADEPTAEQDPVSRALVLDELFAVADAGAALVLATHDPEVAARCDHIVELHAGRATLAR